MLRFSVIRIQFIVTDLEIDRRRSNGGCCPMNTSMAGAPGSRHHAFLHVYVCTPPVGEACRKNYLRWGEASVVRRFVAFERSLAAQILQY